MLNSSFRDMMVKVAVGSSVTGATRSHKSTPAKDVHNIHPPPQVANRVLFCSCQHYRLGKRMLAAPGAKIILITSKMGSMADNSSGGAYG